MKEVKEVSSLDKKKKDYFDKALEVIKNNKFIFQVQDVYEIMGIAHSTFYTYFPAESEEMEAIKQLLNKNKASERLTIRKRWSQEPSPRTDTMYYKITGSTEDRIVLSTQFIETKQPGPQELSEQELNEKIEKLQDGK